MGEALPCPALPPPGDPTWPRSLCVLRAPAPPASFPPQLLALPHQLGGFQCPCCTCWSLGAVPEGTEAQRKATSPVSTSVSLHIPCPTSGYGW